MDRISVISVLISMATHGIAFTVFAVANIERLQRSETMDISFLPYDEPIYEAVPRETLSVTSVLEESDANIFALPSLQGFSRSVVESEIGIRYNAIMWEDEPDLMRLGFSSVGSERAFVKKENLVLYSSDMENTSFSGVGLIEEFYSDDKYERLYFHRDEIAAEFLPKITGPIQTRNVIAYGFENVNKDMLREFGSIDVFLRFWVGEDGAVQFVIIESSSQNSAFDTWCRDQVKAWRFEPSYDVTNSQWGRVRLNAAEIYRGA